MWDVKCGTTCGETSYFNAELSRTPEEASPASAGFPETGERWRGGDQICDYILGHRDAASTPADGTFWRSCKGAHLSLRRGVWSTGSCRSMMPTPPAMLACSFASRVMTRTCMPMRIQNQMDAIGNRGTHHGLGEKRRGAQLCTLG